MREKPKRRRVWSIRWLVSGAAFALIAVTVVAVGGIGERVTRRTLTRELETRMVLAARDLATASSRALLSDYPELVLAPILAEMESGAAPGSFAVVADREGIIRGHANPRLIGDSFALPPGVAPVSVEAPLRVGEQMQASASLLVATAPVTHPGGEPIGTAYVAYPRAAVDGAIVDARQAQVVPVAILLAISLVVVPLYLAHLLRPIGALRAGLERIGAGDLETPVRLTDRTELGLLGEVMNDMARRVRDAQTERLERERLSRELELARQIQSSLLPAGGMSAGGFTIEGLHRAAAEVGGDLYDVFALRDGKIGLAIADVSGKGLAGCLVTSMLSALLRAFRDEEPSPAALLVRLERTLATSLRPGTFVTMSYGILDPATGTFCWASAGHCPLLVYRSGHERPLRFSTKGVPVGAVRGGALAKTVRDETIRLEPGDVLLQFTDGANETFDPSGREQFGVERIEEALRGAARGGAHAVLSRVRADVEAWSNGRPPDDDLTLLAVSAPPGEPRSVAPQPLALLEAARSCGDALTIDADLDALSQLRPWIAARAGLEALDGRQLSLVESALYEVCANVIEHGYGRNGSGRVEVGWVRDTSGAPCASAGSFVVRDDGTPYVPAPKQVDFSDSEVRRRGRGLGLPIIHAMARVDYHPGTAQGNITLLKLEPAPRAEEVTHG